MLNTRQVSSTMSNHMDKQNYTITYFKKNDVHYRNQHFSKHYKITPLFREKDKAQPIFTAEGKKTKRAGISEGWRESINKLKTSAK